MTAPLLLLIALAAPLAPSLARAAPVPPAKAPPGAAAKPIPAHVTADVIRYNWTTRKVTMVGKPFVTLTREDMVLTCRRLLGDNDASGQLARATCEGDVKLVRGTKIVTCERAQYDRDDARVVCEGNPILKDGETEARGKRLTYLLAADEVLLEEAVQATVPSEQIDQVSRKPVPGTPAKAAPTPAKGAAVPKTSPAKPAGGGR
jgi:lipopolysaccharide export system protein LptA